MSPTAHDNIKKTVGDLAIFGGTPTFENALHVGRPNIGDRQKFLERMDDILDKRWLTNGGQYVSEFERKMAELLEVEHCIATCNATIGLEIAIKALGLKGEVIVPSFTFIATAHVLQWLGITPVFADIDRHTHCLDPESVEQSITPQTTGIVGVHLWGRPCDIDSLSEIAERRGLKLLFDSAHAFACSYKGRMIGRFGNAEVFSFHATKFLNTLEGGAVATNDSALAQRVRLMRNFGFSSYDKVDSIGTNGKMNEFCAATGLTNLESINDFIDTNRENYKLYGRELADIEGLTLVTYDDNEKCNYQYIVLEVDEARTVVTRDQLMKVLHSENILARRYFYPGGHLMEPYRSTFPAPVLPETDRLSDRVLSLPTGTSISAADIKTICGIIRMVVANGCEVAGRFVLHR